MPSDYQRAFFFIFMPNLNEMHPRNKHQEKYDFEELTKQVPELKDYVHFNKKSVDPTIDFFDKKAVKLLNKAILKKDYNIDHWDIPDGYLCPPIPGRADYIHHVADVLSYFNKGKIPRGEKISCLDIGVGANCVYPIIGSKEYHWSFVGTDITKETIRSAQTIIDKNKSLKNNVVLRMQPNSKNIFDSVIGEDEYFDLTICNPPFHASAEEAQKANLKKLKNLKDTKPDKKDLNFGGKHKELWTKGGEHAFIQKMILESLVYSKNCFLFSTLISKKSNLTTAYALLEQSKAFGVETVEMTQGNKISHMIAWTFLSEKQQQAWASFRWA